MSVYCDPPFEGLMIRGNTTWSHMGTDDHSHEGLEELHRVARKIGLRREWFQDKPYHPHYDLFPSRRVEAIKAGVKPVSQREYVLKCSKNPILHRLIRKNQEDEQEDEQTKERFSLKG